MLVTEPLSAEQRGAVGWERGQGIADRGNQFHYYRLTPDGRILFGGYDAIYHFGNRVSPQLDRRAASFQLLYDHLTETFPALEGIGITHAWGGPIDTCSRFCVTFGRALGGKRRLRGRLHGARRRRDAASAPARRSTCSTAPTPSARGSSSCARGPLPFPPEPARWAVIQATRVALARADEHGGRRGPWLRLLDRLGLGFDT